jgi:hypothetical protein
MWIRIRIHNTARPRGGGAEQASFKTAVPVYTLLFSTFAVYSDPYRRLHNLSGWGGGFLVQSKYFIYNLTCNSRPLASLMHVFLL